MRRAESSSRRADRLLCLLLLGLKFFDRRYVDADPQCQLFQAEDGGKEPRCIMSTKRKIRTATTISEAQPEVQGRLQGGSSDQRPAQNRRWPGAAKSAGSGSRVSQDKQLAVTVSAYLDGELAGEHLAAFETVLRHNQVLSQEVAGIQRLDHHLKEIGAEILAEPVPSFLLEALSLFPGCMAPEVAR